MVNISIRVKNGRYEFFEEDGRARRRVAAYRRRDAAPIPIGTAEIELDSDVQLKISEMLKVLARAENENVGKIILDLVEKLISFQKALGEEGPGSSGILFGLFLENLLSTYRKVKRMDELIVKRQAG